MQHAEVDLRNSGRRYLILREIFTLPGVAAAGQLKPAESSRAFLVVLLLFLTIGSAARLVDLDTPGFWGDEETMAFAAQAVAEGREPAMPSGLKYNRALLQTYVTAGIATVVGADRDLSYRLPAAAVGVAMLFLVFFGTSRHLGIAVAVAATGLIALSEWHIVMSRTARMYGPLLLFVTAFCFYALDWSKRGDLGSLLKSVFAFVIAATLHFGALIALPLLLMPHLFGRLNKKAFSVSFCVMTSLALFTLIYEDRVVAPPYRDFATSGGRTPMVSFNDARSGYSILDILSRPDILTVVLFAIGIVIGVWAYRVFIRPVGEESNPLRSIATFIAAISFGLFSALGHLYGSFLAAIFLCLIVAPQPWSELKKRRMPLIAGFISLLIWFASVTIAHGPWEGAQLMLRYPFPYLLLQALEFPGVVILFFAAIADAVLSPDSPSRRTIRYLAICVLLPIFIIGLFREWAPPRYFAVVYPLMLIVAASAIVRITSLFMTLFRHHYRYAMPASIAILVGSGLLGGHGVRQVVAQTPPEYGSRLFSAIESYPDHRAPGCFVRKHSRPGDIIVGEDALQLFWYAGRVDYWLRDPSTHRLYSYLDQDELQRDVYVASVVTTDDQIAALHAEKKRRIWLVTSGETRLMPEFYLGENTPQRNWIDSVMNSVQPVLKGRDGLSAVYCLNCRVAGWDPDPSSYDCR